MTPYESRKRRVRARRALFLLLEERRAERARRELQSGFGVHRTSH
ncbi:hypothetical protein BH09ACT10_BH09ACT10_19730 [soil metagenome]